MSLLRNWIVNIVLVIIISSLVDILLPNSEMRKYVKFFSGLILIIIILTPIIKLLGTEAGEQIIKTGIEQNSSFENIQPVIRNIEQVQEDMAVEIYENKLESHIKTILKDTVGERDIKIKIKFDDLMWSEQEGKVEKVDIYFSNMTSKDGDRLETESLSNSEKEKIKESVSKICDINREDISIYIQ